MKSTVYILLYAVLSAIALQGRAQGGASNMEFVENKGQWDSQVRFKGEMSTGAFFLTKKGFTVLLHNPDDLARLTAAHHGAPDPVSDAGTPVKKTAAAALNRPGARPGTDSVLHGDGIHSHVYNVSFVGSNEGVEIIPDKPLPSYNNYFIGNDSSKWAGNCRIFQGITYKNMYPNVDVRYYSENGQLKYNIIVHPGGDVEQIALKYEGADKLEIRKNQLVVNTSVGQVKELTPYTYQFDETGRTEVGCKYSIREGNTVRFKVGQHAPGSTLIIDPTLVFCSFTGSKASNWGFTATPGPDGSFYAGGIVFNSGYPVSPGVVGPSFGGGEFDVGVIKLSANGSTRVYATYLGGNNNETPHSMICDAQGNLVVLGRTYSLTGFPHKTVAGNLGGADMFVIKLNAAGNTIIGGMLIGGSGDDCVNMFDQLRNGDERADTLIRNYGDDSRSEVVLDGSNNICVAASTQSSAPTVALGGFPIVGSVFQPNFAGGLQDAVVLKIDPTCNHILWSSFLGGSGRDAAFVLKANPVNGDLYVGGATASTDFPGNKTNVIQSVYAGGSCDGFVTVISGDGTTQRKSTYLGTDAAESVYGLEVDKKGFPYIMGSTNGSWTVTPNVGYSNPGAKQFISKLQPDLSAYVYSTVFGSASRLPNISPVAFLVDRCENVYVSGWGGWIIGGGTDLYGLSGTTGMPITPNAIKKVTDNRDFYFIVLQKNAASLLYGTFFGQQDMGHSISEHVDGGTSRYDQNGVIYEGICANCDGGTTIPFPTTPGVWAPKNGTGSGGCNEAAVKIAFNLAGVAGGLRVSVNGRAYDTSGCVPLAADFRDTIRNAKSYIWNFGDGGPDTATTSYEVSHTYNNPGRYTVMMIAIDTNSCNGADTIYRHVIAGTNKALLGFTYVKTGPCESLNYLFTNTSVAPPGIPFGDSSFVWDFGDQTGAIQTNNGALPHSFASAGTYIINLTLVDTNYCNYQDTVSRILRVSPQAKAEFITPSTGCAPYMANFNNVSLGGLKFYWYFGDGSPVDSEANPIHLYASPGTYTIKMVEYDSTTCNKADSTQQTIVVSGKPTASFTFAPAPPEANTPITFTNGSTGGVRYEWYFGDGDSATQTSLDTIQHLYIRTDTFQVCLVTFNQYGCTDTACHPVATLINPLLDVPNAFTPGRFGQNGVVKVMGFGITHLQFRIYNRWGQLVFASTDQDLGWDGTFKGVLQPMDVYGYTLEADFSNGKHVSKKGDITLIR